MKYFLKSGIYILLATIILPFAAISQTKTPTEMTNNHNAALFPKGDKLPDSILQEMLF